MAVNGTNEGGDAVITEADRQTDRQTERDRERERESQSV